MYNTGVIAKAFWVGPLFFHFFILTFHCLRYRQVPLRVTLPQALDNYTNRYQQLMKYITFIVLLSSLGFNQNVKDSTRPNYLKLDQILNFTNDTLKTDTLKVKLIKKEQVQVNYNQKLDTLYFQGAYGPISNANLDSIDYVNWDYVSDNLVIVFTDTSLSLITKNPDTNTNFKKSW